MHHRCRLSMAIALSMLLVACSTTRPVASWQTDLQTGDKVRVTTTSAGKPLKLAVTAVTSESLEGLKKGAEAPSSIPAEDIMSVQRKKISPGKTFLMVTGTVLLLVTLSAIAVGPAGVLSVPAY